jgi:heme A synthase
MGNTKKVFLTSIVCWSSAILLGLSGILILTSIDRSSPEYSYLLILGAVMVFSWASLLVWADRDHSYRKGVFAITGLMTVGLLFAQMYGYSIGVLSLKVTVAIAISLGALIVLFTLSYLAVKRSDCPKRYNTKHFDLKHLLARILQ